MGNNTSKPSRTNISDLPDDVMYAIFRLIDALQLLPLSRVCKRWGWLIDDSRLRKVLNFDFQCIPANELHLTSILSYAPLLHTIKIVYLCDKVINRVITVLAENCPHLSVLELLNCPYINEESWQVIGTAPWPHLTRLSLPICRVDDRVLATILSTLSTVTVLDFTINNNITDDGILCITGHTPNLRCLLLCLIYSLTSASTVPLLDAVGSHLTQLSLSDPERALLTALPTACVCLRVLALSLDDSSVDAVSECLQRLTHLTYLRLSSSYHKGGPSRGLRGFFDGTRDFRSRLEYLAFIDVPVDDYVLGDMARTCGSHLRYLSIIDNLCAITAVGLTEVANLCTAIEHLELDLRQTSNKNPAFANVISNLSHLRIFVFQAKAEYIKSLKGILAGIMPNVLVCSWDDLQAQYKRWRLPDISRSALQYGSFR